MKIVIAGAGSIGTVVGLILAKNGNEVEFLRRGSEEGIITMFMEGVLEFEQKISVKLTSKEYTKSEVDIIFITTQTQQTMKIISFIKDNYIVNSLTTFVILQNGLDTFQPIVEHFIDANVVQGVVWWSATMINEHLVYYHRSAPTFIGHILNTDKTKMIKDLLSDNLEIQIVDDIATEVRSKLLLNVVSPVLALTKEPYPQGLENEFTRKIVHILYDEVLLIAKSKDWDTEDTKLTAFHQRLASNQTKSDTIQTKFKHVHKVSSQISAEKHGGKGSNARVLLSYFISNGAKACEIVLDYFENLQINYDPVSNSDLNIILNKINGLDIKCNLN